MTLPVISSTFVLTLLLAVGFFFFVRASVKDRTQQEKLVAEQGADSLLIQLKEHLSSRAYEIAAINPEENEITFKGVVRPSVFLAVFLTVLTAIGTLCLGLVLSMVVESSGSLFFGFVLFSPLAGFFYWQQAQRSEQVSFKLEAVLAEEGHPRSLITATGHRDELAVLKQTLQLTSAEEALKTLFQGEGVRE